MNLSIKMPGLFVIGAVLALSAMSAKGEGTDAAAKTFAQVCATCHGPTGQGMASFPRLVDKDADFIVSRLKQYRNRETVGPNSPLMIPHAVNLSDAQIVELADHIVKLSQ